MSKKYCTSRKQMILFKKKTTLSENVQDVLSEEKSKSPRAFLPFKGAQA
jgi:hypothetical protein